MTDAVLVTAVVTILVAFTGYLATYFNNLRLSQRNQRLERVSRQLGELYGPLYGLNEAETTIWQIFRARYRPEQHFFDEEDPPTEEELEAWRLWMTTVFAPMNNQMHELVLSKSDLLIETEMPECLRELCAHVVGYQLVMRKWEREDFSENLSLVPFPSNELTKYLANSYHMLKAEQARLLGRQK